MTDLTGKTAIVTGAGRSLGRAMAAGLVEAGATVALVELDRDVLDEAVKKIGDGCIGIAADISSPDEAQRIVNETQRFRRHAYLGQQRRAWPGTVPRYRPFQRQDDLGNRFHGLATVSGC